MTFASFAQDCPPGQYPVAGQGWNYCAPAPAAAQEEPQQQQATGPQWKDVWQATAIDAGTGSLGTSIGRATEKGAVQSALSDCQDEDDASCEVQISMKNGCIAMVVGDKLLNTKGGSTESEAINKATTDCKAKNSTCRVYYSHCDYPIRV